MSIIIRKLVGDFMKPIYRSNASSELKLKRFDSSLMPEKSAEYIYRDIFLWCILTHRLEMAKIFLGQMKTRICSALIASKILKSLAEYALDHQSKEILKNEADEFERCAIECVRCAYVYDAEQACELVIRRIYVYGSVSCLQMAIAADNKKFLYEDACDALLTYIWYDKLDPLGERYRLIINILTMGMSQIFFSIYDKRLNRIEADEQESNVSLKSFYSAY